MVPKRILGGCHHNVVKKLGRAQRNTVQSAFTLDFLSARTQVANWASEQSAACTPLKQTSPSTLCSLHGGALQGTWALTVAAPLPAPSLLGVSTQLLDLLLPQNGCLAASGQGFV